MVETLARRAERYAGFAVLAVSFTAYLLTLAPGVTFWDSGELIYGAVALGVPHPPAYPAFCILGKAASLLPLGNAAYRLNVMSALFGSLTVYLLYRLSLELIPPGSARVPVSAGASLFLAFTVPFWSQAVVAEVYTPNALLLAGIAYTLYRFDSEGGVSYLHASAFLLGLAFAMHQSAVFLLPVYAAYYLYAGGVVRDPKRALVSLFFVIFGYSSILYLPLRASASPPINIGDPQVLYWFKWVLRIEDHIKTLQTVPGKLSLISGGDALLPVAAAAVCALLAWSLRKRPYLLFLIFASASYYAGITVLTAGDPGIRKWGLHVKFYIPILLFAAPVVAALAGSVFAGRAGGSTLRGRVAAVALALLLLALPAGAAYHWFRDCDNSRNFFAFDFATNTLKSVRQDGVVFAWGDNGIFPVWYLQGYERYRDDILFIHTEILTHPWYMEQAVNRIYRKFGVAVKPPSGLVKLDSFIPVLKFSLEKWAPVYFDYSAVSTLEIDMSRLEPQGLVHLSSSWKPEDLSGIWGRYVLRGMLDDTTNKVFAAEGIIPIYGYEATLWAIEANKAGMVEEALRAYGLARELGAGNSSMDRWARGLKKRLGNRSRD